MDQPFREMSGRSSNQSVASPMKRIRSELVCPVCLNIPRDLPIPSCPSGHFVCRPCKKRVRDCPTCRQPMPPNMTNSLVGALIEQVQHKCKFADHGCEVKMMLKDLVTHEKTCPDRTIKCPYTGCAQVLKLKNFDIHALHTTRHSRILDTRDGRLVYPITVNNTVYDIQWSLVGIKELDQLFHVNFGYYEPSKCFVFSIWLSKSQNVASKYVAKITIEGDKKNLCFEGISVSSVENVPSMNKCMEKNGNIFLCLPISLARSICAKNKGIDQEDLVVGFSFKKI